MQMSEGRGTGLLWAETVFMSGVVLILLALISSVIYRWVDTAMYVDSPSVRMVVKVDPHRNVAAPGETSIFSERSAMCQADVDATFEPLMFAGQPIARYRAQRRLLGHQCADGELVYFNAQWHQEWRQAIQAAHEEAAHTQRRLQEYERLRKGGGTE